MRQPLALRAYCRVSSRDQGDRGTSLPAQRERIEAWYAARGWTCPIHWYTEVESGGEERREKRVELTRLLAEARPGELVAVSLVDRWGRSAIDVLVDVRTLRQRRTSWVAIDEDPELVVDHDNDRGLYALEQRAAGAAEERRRIKRRTVGARHRAKDAGLWAEGPAPFGYRRGDRGKKRQLHLDVVPEEAALVVEAFRRCVAGQSVEEISAWLNVERGTTKDKRQTWTLLHKRIYLGEVPSSRRGEWIKGQHEAIVDRDLWERAQAALTARQNGGGPKAHSARTNAWLLRGLGSCPSCGARMGAAYSRGTDYYACGNRLRYGTCDADYARVDRVDPLAAAQTLARLVELRVELATPGNDAPAPSALPDFARRRQQLAAELVRAEGGWVRGVLSEDGLRRARERVDGELGRLAVAEGAAARAAKAQDPGARARILAQAGRIEQAWGLAPVELRRAALGLLARRVTIYAARVEIAWKSLEELCTSTDDAHLFAAPDDVQPDPPPPVAKRGRR